MTHAMLRAALRSGVKPWRKGDRAMTYSFELVLVVLVLRHGVRGDSRQGPDQRRLHPRVVQLLPRAGVGLAGRRRPGLRRGGGRRRPRHGLPAADAVADAPGGHRHPADAAAARRLPGPGAGRAAAALRRRRTCRRSATRRTPANLHIAPIYVENSVADTRTPNVVTSIIMDYRGFDTLIETCVIFAAGIASAAVRRKALSR